MIWLTWRQFRTSAAVVFAAVAALAAVLALTGPGLADEYAAGLARCTGDCSRFVEDFFQDNQKFFLAVSAAMLVLPVLIGLFWGAPLITRELEAGTHRLVWNQTITRTRWLAVKLGLAGLAAVIVAGVGSLAATWWASTFDQNDIEDFPRLSSLVFDARGVVPIGYAVFAFALGVTVGMLARRTLPAMVVTLVVFVAVQVAMPTLVRPYVLPPTRATVEFSESILDTVNRLPDGTIQIEAKAPDPGGWLLDSQTVDASGKPVDSIPMGSSQACAPSGVPGDLTSKCLPEINRLGYRQELTYHAPTRFWPFQWVETGIYLALALGLAGFSFWWLRRRLS